MPLHMNNNCGSVAIHQPTRRRDRFHSCMIRCGSFDLFFSFADTKHANPLQMWLHIDAMSSLLASAGLAAAFVGSLYIWKQSEDKTR